MSQEQPPAGAKHHSEATENGDIDWIRSLGDAAREGARCVQAAWTSGEPLPQRQRIMPHKASQYTP
jgi:hypothetical protein